MKISMLEYSKLILEKVSFDSWLFANELRKSKRALMNSEIDELRHWCEDKFGERYQEEIQKYLGGRITDTVN
jgi:hypothetical protein